MAGRVIQGFGATAFESLSLATVGDIFYLHDRGWRTALIVLTLACMASLVSIISGVITENLGYRDLFTILLPFQVAGFLGTVFLLPESQFQREERIVAATHDSEQKNLDTDVEVCHKETAAPSEVGEFKPRKTYVQSLAPFSQVYSNRNAFILFAEIFVHLLNPAVVWILLTSAVIVVCVTTLKTFV
jgi:MFS family permease